MTQFLSGTSHGLGFLLWAAVGLLVSQVARLPGKGWLTAGFWMLAARSLLHLIGPGHPTHDDPTHEFGPLLVAGAIGCCLVGVVVGGASQAAASSGLPGVGGWWSGLPWVVKAAAGGAALATLAVVFVASMMVQHEYDSERKYHSLSHEDEYDPYHHDDAMDRFPPGPTTTHNPEGFPTTGDTDAERRHNEASELELRADSQLSSGDKIAAKDSYRRAATIESDLAADYPKSPGYQYTAAVDLREAANLEADVGTNDAATAAYTEARGRLEKLVEDYPDQTNYLNALAGVYEAEMKFYANTNRQPEADEAAAKAMKLREKLKAMNDGP